MVQSNLVSFVDRPRTSKNKKYKRKIISRIEQLKPIVLQEILARFTDSEYFTRDHLLYFTSLRQFSMAYRIYLVREIISHYIQIGKLVKFNQIDVGVATPKNTRRFRNTRKTNEVAYSGSYTTRSADELLTRVISPKLFNSKELADWLSCLDHLAPVTRYNYSKRIIDDLVRRGVIIAHIDSKYSVNEH